MRTVGKELERLANNVRPDVITATAARHELGPIYARAFNKLIKTGKVKRLSIDTGLMKKGKFFDVDDTQVFEVDVLNPNKNLGLSSEVVPFPGAK